MTSTKRMIAILLAALALSLLLTACSSNGGGTPTGDNTTPGVTDTQTLTPDNTTEPDTTPGASDTTPPGASDADTPVKKDFAWLDPSNYDTEKKKEIDDLIEYYGGDEVDIDKLIEEAFVEYSEYINENITLESVRTAIVAARVPMTYRDNKNLTKMPESSLQKVNDYLQSCGAEPLDSADYKQDIAALAIAASICYESNRDGIVDPLWDLGKSFDDAFDYTGNVGPVAGGIMNNYYVPLD